MPKDYIGKRQNRVLMPGDPGYNDPRLPWGSVRNVTGWQKPDAVMVEIAGFFLIDRRTNPPLAVFKNMTIVGEYRKVSIDPPVPFDSLDEALHHKESMHLSMKDAELVRPVALAPDPGMGNPHPDVMFVTRKQSKGM